MPKKETTARTADMEIVFIVDKSGSMGGLESDTIGGFNAMLKEQQALPGNVMITTVLFDHEYELLHDRIDIHSVSPMTDDDYQVRGNTALLDAIGKTIHRVRDSQKPIKEELRGKALFFIITDGQENASREFSYKKVKELIDHQKGKHGWEFIFMGANIDEIGEAAKMGIDAANAFNYTADAKGLMHVWGFVGAVSTAHRNRK